MTRTAAIFLTLWLSLLSGSASVYNPGGETNADLSSFDYSQPQSGDISHTSGYDNLGNVIYVVETYSGLPGRDVLNSYDRTNRLVTEQDTDSGHVTLTSYTYTENNSRYDRTVRVDNGVNHVTRFRYGNPNIGYNSDQLYGVGKLDANPQPGNDSNFKYRYTYDADGNRATRVTDPGTAAEKVDHYLYDQRNRLVAVYTIRTSDGATLGSNSYLYDERTRRTSTTEGFPAGFNRRLSFSGGSYVQEYGPNTASLPTLQLVRGSDMGGGVGGILYNDGSGGVAFNNYNSRGDVVSQTNTGGAVAWTGKYDAFGTHTDSTTSVVGRQRANSKDEDPTGLLNEGMRYRDLEAGIFLTRDPAGLVDGPNVYTYVNQNPWTKFDPTGLSALRMWDHLFHGEFKEAAMEVPSCLTPIPLPISLDGSNPFSGVVQAAKTTAAIAREDGGVDAALYVANSFTGGQQLAEGLARTGTGSDEKGNVSYPQISEREGNLRILEGGSQLVMTAAGGKSLADGLIGKASAGKLAPAAGTQVEKSAAATATTTETQVEAVQAVEAPVATTVDGAGKSIPVSEYGVPSSDFTPKEGIGPYKRPSKAGPTAEQRAAVQGKPCVVCGEEYDSMVADHIDPLAVEHYRTGGIDISTQTSVEAVEPHCTDCSSFQGGKMSGFSKKMKNKAIGKPKKADD